QHNVNWISGKHSLKGGYDLLRQILIWDLDSTGAGAIQTRFNNLQTFVRGLANIEVALDYTGNNAVPGQPVMAPLKRANQRYHKGVTPNPLYWEDPGRLPPARPRPPGRRGDFFGPASSPDLGRVYSLYFGEGANYWERFANAKLLPVTEAPGSYRGVNRLRR